jgi:hypothetical protein
MAETLENLVAEGKMVVETQEDRVKRMAEEVAAEKERKESKERIEKQIKARKEFLRTNIDHIRLEVEFAELQNQYTETQIRKDELMKIAEQIDAANAVLTEESNDQNNSESKE